jgi:hypothetical protein
MKIINHTTYPTRELRKFLLAGHKAHGADTNKVITIKWSRHGMHWGCASYSGSSMMLTIPKGKLSMTEFALLFEHELAHNLGLRHGEMDEAVRYCQGKIPAWAVGFDLKERAEPERVDPVVARETHARKMLERWEKKLERAKRQRSKWAVKVRYYDRKSAAVPKAQ